MGCSQINQGISRLELVSGSSGGYARKTYYCADLLQVLGSTYHKLSLGFVFYCENYILGDFVVLCVC